MLLSLTGGVARAGAMDRRRSRHRGFNLARPEHTETHSTFTYRGGLRLRTSTRCECHTRAGGNQFTVAQ
jgi:hypothetical protein